MDWLVWLAGWAEVDGSALRRLRPRHIKLGVPSSWDEDHQSRVYANLKRGVPSSWDEDHQSRVYGNLWGLGMHTFNPMCPNRTVPTKLS